MSEPSKKVIPLTPDAMPPADKMIVTLTVGELREVIRKEISKAAPKPEKLLFTPEEAAEKLSLKKSWLLTSSRTGKIECTRKGHYILFTKAQIEAIAEKSDPKKELERRN